MSVFNTRQDQLRTGFQFAASFGECHRATNAIEQSDLHLVLEQGDPFADRRLSKVQATSGDGEGASVRYSNESFNSLEIYHLRWVSWRQFGLFSFQIIINSIKNMNLSYRSKNPNMRKLKIKRELAGFQFSKRMLVD